MTKDKALEELRKLPPVEYNALISKVTKNNVTPQLEDVILNICSIDQVGRKAALEILFALGIALNEEPEEKQYPDIIADGKCRL